MKVYNGCEFPIIAYCWDERIGFGEDVLILPNTTGEVPGPSAAMASDRVYSRIMSMEIKCHELSDNKYYYHVSAGNQLCVGYGPCGITVRHHEEERQIQDATQCNGHVFHIDTKGCEKYGFKSGEKVLVVKSRATATVRGTSKKPSGLEIPCMPDLEEVLWIRVDGMDHDTMIFDPQLSLRKLDSDQPPS